MNTIIAEFETIILTLIFSIAIIATTFLAWIIIYDIRRYKRKKYLKTLLSEIIVKKGHDYVERIVYIAYKCGLGIEYLIEVFEADLEIVHNTRRKK